MNKTKLKSLTYILSFLLPAVAMTAIFAISHFYPFGESSVLVTDMSQQYIDYFADFRRLLLGEGSILYSWNGGLGMNYIGIYAYYLSSPFAFLVLFFPEGMITEAVMTMIILKVGCAGTAFTAFLNYRTHKLKYSYLLFCCAYALMSFCTVYYFNIMWLDALILLPVICMGLHRLVEKSRSDLFIISLFLMFYSNFYISFMTGIAVFMYFLMIVLFEDIKPEKRELIKIFVKFFVGVFLAAGLSAVLLLPAYKALSSSYIDMMPFGFTGSLYSTPVEIIEKSLPGVYDSVTTHGLPNIYCGILSFATLPLFFFNDRISKKQKICGGVILGLFILSFVSYDVEVIWHGLKAPAWFNARHSFTYSFFVILFSFITLCKPKGIKKSHIKWGFWISVMFVALAFFAGDFTSGTAAIISIIMILLVYGLIYLYIGGWFDLKKKKISAGALKTVAVSLLLVCSLSEAIFSGCVYIKGLDDELGIFERNYYTDFIESTKPAVEAAKEYERQNENSALYRLENADMRFSNDNMALGYNGLAHYSSMSNQHTFTNLNRLGYLCEVNNRYLRYYGTTDILDSILGIKYVLSKDSVPEGYPLVGREGDYKIYRNPRALSVGFGASSNIFDYNCEQPDPFTAQNEFVSSLLGEETECFTLADYKLELNDVIVKDFGDEFYIRRDGISPYMLFNITTPKDGQVFLWMKSSIAENCTIFVNGHRYGTSHDGYLKGSINLGSFSAGDNITVKILLDYGIGAYIWNINSAVMNRETVDTALLKLSRNNMTDVSLKKGGSVLTGKVTMEKDGVLFTSIPYDEGWKVSVNGKKWDYKDIGSKGFIALELPKGDYDIEFEFFPMGLKAGIGISCVSLILVLLYFIWEAYGRKWQKR